MKIASFLSLAVGVWLIHEAFGKAVSWGYKENCTTGSSQTDFIIKIWAGINDTGHGISNAVRFTPVLADGTEIGTSSKVQFDSLKIGSYPDGLMDGKTNFYASETIFGKLFDTNQTLVASGQAVKSWLGAEITVKAGYYKFQFENVSSILKPVDGILYGIIMYVPCYSTAPNKVYRVGVTSTSVYGLSPTGQPTDQPTGQPSSQPTGQPTSAPSLKPCSHCRAGQYFDDSCSSKKCVSCQPGYYCPGLCASPIPCAAGRYNPDYLQTNSSSCVSCSPGYYSAVKGSSACYPCLAGYQCSNSTSYPKPCPKGYYSLQGAHTCTKCASGTYASSTGSSSCSPCPAGYACPDATAGKI